MTKNTRGNDKKHPRGDKKHPGHYSYETHLVFSVNVDVTKIEHAQHRHKKTGSPNISGRKLTQGLLRISGRRLKQGGGQRPQAYPG